MRPGCDRPAVSRLSYDTISCQVWLDPVPERPGPAQEICELHTSRLTVPRGWVLCDRRGDAPALFVTPPTAAPTPPARNGTARNGRSSNGRSSDRTARNGSSDRPTDGETRTPRRRVRTAPAPVLFESPVDADDSGPETPRTARRNGDPSTSERRVAATVPVSVEPVQPTEPAEPVEPAAEQPPVPAAVDEVHQPDESEQADQPDEHADLPTSPLLARAFRATGPQRSVLTQTLLNDAD